MTNLLIGLFSALLATNHPQAVSNLVLGTTGVSVEVHDPNDPVEKEYQKILTEDDDSQAEADKWIRENQAFGANGAAVSPEELNQRIMTRFNVVRKAYEVFLGRHPDHARARLAYGSFLGDIHDDDGAVEQLEKARELDPKNPASWNNLANHYGHDGEVKKAFEYYAKAIELNPSEPVYYHNFGTTVYLFRKDATEYYGITEQQVFDKALGLYKQAMALAPNDLVLATDYAESYYGIKPMPTNDALMAWTNCYNICKDENEREGVLCHLARVKIATGMFDGAQANLDAITNQSFAGMKQRLERSMEHYKRPESIPDASANTPVAPTNQPTPPHATNSAPVSTNATKLFIAPPGLREQKTQ